VKIEWAEPALIDLESIRDYIRKGSEYYATRFVERVVEAVESLEKLPEKGRRVPESKEKNIRELIFYNYRIIYRIEPNRVLVLGVIHGARNLGQRRVKPWDVF
jgi:plasmid stabilization system protein ParE